MVFKRRDKQSLLQRLRTLLHPGKGWKRSFQYVGHRVKRIPDTSHKIALGAAIGVLVCFSPILGVHVPITLIIVYILRANYVAALITSLGGNAATYPFIATACVGLGRSVLGMNTQDEDFQRLHIVFWQAFTDLWQFIQSLFGFAERPDGLADFISNLFLPYLVGGTIIGLVLGAITYFLLKPVVTAYQIRRRHVMAERRQKRREERDSKADSGQ